MPIPRDIARTQEADVRSLVDERASESSYLEFKRELPGNDNAARHEFLADVTAFANSTGGDIIYGIEELDGHAAGIVPFQDDQDAAARRLSDILLNGVEPRLPGVQIQPVTVDQGHVLVVRVPQSWAGPHRVKTNQHFFIRDNGRKRQLDVPEVRGLFLRSADQGRQVRDFRTERLGHLLSGALPVRLVDGPAMMVHLIPSDAALGLMSVDPVLYQQTRFLPLIGTNAANPRLNIDGALAVRTENANGTHGYSQFFRNGFFESVKVETHQPDAPASFGSVAYERNLIQLVRLFRGELTHLGAGTDMTAMLSISRANNVRLGVNPARFFIGGNEDSFDRETIVIPDVLLKGEMAVETALRPLFDLVWQAAGLQRSFNYDENGNWVGQ